RCRSSWLSPPACKLRASLPPHPAPSFLVPASHHAGATLRSTRAHARAPEPVPTTQDHRRLRRGGGPLALARLLRQPRLELGSVTLSGRSKMRGASLFWAVACLIYVTPSAGAGDEPTDCDALQTVDARNQCYAEACFYLHIAAEMEMAGLSHDR